MNIKDIPINSIKIIENVRVKIDKLEGLMQDIKNHGLYNPIKVAKTKTSEFILVQGNRRLAACKKLGWKKIPANVSEDMEIAELLINNMAENVHREDINPIELGRVCTRLKDQLDLNESEISAKLSVPIGRINGAMQAYKGMPDKYRNKVAYVGGGNARNGNIPATVALKVLATKRNYGLSDSAVDKLMKVAKMEEYGTPELFLISRFLEEGLTVTQAIEKAKEFTYSRFDLIVNNAEVEAALAKHKMDNKNLLFTAILYGELPPLKRPAFLKAKQVPVKE